MKILNLKCKLTNCYLIECNCGWVMIDTDFPGTFTRLIYLLKQHDIEINSIKYLIITHFHPDHAGIAQELKGFGINLILHENQVSFIDKLNNFLRKDTKYNFKDITTDDNIVLSSAESRKFFEDMGIEGELIPTPGHTDDSISLIIDGCCAFTGDLPAFGLMEAYNDQTIKESWESIQNHNITRIYPAHGNSYTLT